MKQTSSKLLLSLSFPINTFAPITNPCYTLTIGATDQNAHVDVFSKYHLLVTAVRFLRSRLQFLFSIFLFSFYPCRSSFQPFRPIMHTCAFVIYLSIMNSHTTKQYRQLHLLIIKVCKHLQSTGSLKGIQDHAPLTRSSPSYIPDTWS